MVCPTNLTAALNSKFWTCKGSCKWCSKEDPWDASNLSVSSEVVPLGRYSRWVVFSFLLWFFWYPETQISSFLFNPFHKALFYNNLLWGCHSFWLFKKIGRSIANWWNSGNQADPRRWEHDESGDANIEDDQKLALSAQSARRLLHSAAGDAPRGLIKSHADHHSEFIVS